ncbi:xanthine dehydrogenase family protein molybdopterin-binding subunit [Neorhizobium sp. T7_12]|uniref:xanthine dehydrogenase family protein molybdopterin-binding subunit n=1 Tax=Neorhizobium sp. T7_12 TaxID=2093832 RepID=UPI000CF8B36D|nr:xanthine dehydrogenase family protein molybdopterin-binding subunit [Neorhizobium sp. T7_12]
MTHEFGIGSTAHVRHGSNAGQPLTRRDGMLKVAGTARYAGDNHPEGMLYAVMVESNIARGRVTSFDLTAAKAHPGVVEVMTPKNRPSLAADPDLRPNPFMMRLDVLQNDRVRYARQPIAVVIAETLEAATEGAALLAPRYDVEQPRLNLDSTESFVPKVIRVMSPPEDGIGDIEAGFAAGVTHIDATYETPDHYHNPMEPHAVVASWDGDRLSIDMSTQNPTFTHAQVAYMFGLPTENIQIRSPWVGGGFGGKGMLASPTVLGILAARLVDRPVKLVLRRDQMYGSVGHRAPTRQRLRLSADDEGKLTALDHQTLTATSSFDEFIEPAGDASHVLYASPAMSITHRAVRVDMGTPVFMRAPGEAPGSAALESAMDELAWASRIDPLDFRLRNYSETEPLHHKPFSSKELRECYRQGAERFGWSRRPLEPRRMRNDNGFLVGWGMGTATFPAITFQAAARAKILSNGTGVVEISSADMGQGSFTALAQIAADSLGLDIEQLEFHAGKSDLPDGGIEGASAHTATAGSAIAFAGDDAIGKLAELATGDENSPLFGAGNTGVIARAGRLYRRDDENRSESYADIMARAGTTMIEGNGTCGPNPAAKSFSMHSHGAVFAEVTVDPDLGQVRVTRLVGAFAAGRVINPRLVRSQYYGGMIWGISFALHEEAIVDRRTGMIINADLAEYRIPVNADVPSIEAILIEEHDPYVNALGTKGVGEIGITGTVGAIANAIWHATGVRVRRFPIRIEDIILPHGQVSSMERPQSNTL